MDNREPRLARWSAALLGRRALVFASLFAMATFLLGGAAGAAAATPPKLAIAGPSSFTAVIRGGSDKHTATIHVLIENSGDTPTDLTADALVDDSPNPGCRDSHVMPQLNPTHIDAHTAAPVRVVIPVAQACAGRSGTLVITGPIGVDPATTRFALTRTLGGAKTSIPATVAAVLGFLSLLALVLLARGVWFLTSDGIAIGPGWTLSGSWLTNVGAVGAILGTVLGATSYLSDLVPGLATAPFVGLSLAFGGVIVSAPVVYYAFSSQQADPAKPGTNATVTIGSGRGLAALMALTLFGIYGELASLGLLIHESDRPSFETIPLLIGLAVAAAAASVYAVRSTRGTIRFAISNQKPAQLAGVAL